MAMDQNILFKESALGMVDTADVLVKIDKKETMALIPRRYANINVLAKKKTSGRDVKGILVTASTKSDHNNNIEEFSELNFVGVISLWNVDNLTQSDIDMMRSYGDTLVVLSGQTASIKSQLDLDFGQMIVWFTETSTTTSMRDMAKKSRRGVFIDVQKKEIPSIGIA